MAVADSAGKGLANVVQGKKQRDKKIQFQDAYQDTMIAMQIINSSDMDDEQKQAALNNHLQQRVDKLGAQGANTADTQGLMAKPYAEQVAELRGIASTFAQNEAQLKAIGLVGGQQDNILTASQVSPTGQVYKLTNSGGVVAEEVEGYRGENKEDPQGQINTLRGGIADVTKSFRQVEESYSRIQKVGNKGTAASDMSLIFNFMKMLDPGSTVREGEFATAQNAAGVPERVANLYNRAMQGTRLGDDQRADFMSQAQDLFSAQRLATDNQIENILQQADQDQISRERVFGSERLKSFNERRDAGKNPPRDKTGPITNNTPLVNGKGWGLQQDANGNRAYVGPNGEIEEVN